MYSYRCFVKLLFTFLSELLINTISIIMLGMKLFILLVKSTTFTTVKLLFEDIQLSSIK